MGVYLADRGPSMGWSQGLARKLARPARGGPSPEWSQDVVRELTYLADERWSRMTDNTLHLPHMMLNVLSMTSFEAFSLSFSDSKLARPARGGLISKMKNPLDFSPMMVNVLSMASCEAFSLSSADSPAAYLADERCFASSTLDGGTTYGKDAH